MGLRDGGGGGPLVQKEMAKRVGEHIGNASLSLGWVQSAENLGRVPLCARCASVIGTPAELLAAAASIEPPPEVLMGMRSAAAGRGDWEVRGDSGRESAGLPAPAPASSATAATQPLVQCELGCGQAYCSLECEEEDSVEGVHAQLCCGPHGEDHPLTQLRYLGMVSSAFDTVMLAAKIAVGLGVHSPRPALLALWRDTLVKEGEAAAPQWWEHIKPDPKLPPEAQAQAGVHDAFRAVVGQSWALLTTGLQGNGCQPAGVKQPFKFGSGLFSGGGGTAAEAVEPGDRIRGLLPGFNGTHWGRLLAVVASKSVTVQAPTPLHRYFAELAAAAPSVRRAAMPTVVTATRAAIAARAEEERRMELFMDEGDDGHGRDNGDGDGDGGGDGGGDGDGDGHGDGDGDGGGEGAAAHEHGTGAGCYGVDAGPVNPAGGKDEGAGNDELTGLAHCGTQVGDAELFDSVLQDPAEHESRMAPMLLVTALFPNAGAVRHSCVPNCELNVDEWPAATLGARPGVRTVMVAKREIVIGEPLTVCYIDDADSTDLDERTDALESRGLAPCQCPRCVSER